MDYRKFVRDYKKFLEENFNPEKAEKEKAYLFSSLKHYGIYVGQRNVYFKSVKQELSSLTKKDVIALAKRFWIQHSFEEKAMALRILELHAEKLKIGDMALIEKMMRESQGWALLDSLIIPLMPGILQKDKKAFSYLKKWIKDNDFWVRRSALLAQLLFFRSGSEGDRKLFFAMAESQFDERWIGEVYLDKEQRRRAKFFIRKAIGWVLREMSHKQPGAVCKFLKDNKDKMSGLTYREGSRKLPKAYVKYS